MATRMNMMKLLLEVRGMAQLVNRRLPNRTPGPLLLHWPFASRSAAAKRKWTLRIDIQDPPDIPQPVPIIYRTPPQ
jgi:hypothetical protein